MSTQKIKILNFITHFGVGGTERQFVYMTRGLDRSRFDVSVGCLARIGSFYKEIEPLNLPVLEYNTNSMYSYSTLRGQFRLARDIRRRGIQLIHAYGFYPNLFTVPASMLTRNCVTIASVRDMGAFSDRQKIRSMTQTVMCRLADCVLANSYAVKGWLIKQGLADRRIQVIPNGIVVPPPRASNRDLSIRSEFGIDHAAPLIAVVGRLTRIKGLEYFIDALPSIVLRFPDVRVLIIGEACVQHEYRVELEKRTADLNLTGRVIFAGQRNDVPKIMQEIDISVLPSLTESFSNTLLESMANGVPTIATNVGGNPELISDGTTGILVKPQDPAALSAAVLRILESPDLACRLGQAARERVIKDFSLGSVLRQTENLYLTLLENRHRTFRPM